MHSFSCHTIKNKGFSLLEVVMVMAILGILVSVAGSPWPGGVFIQAQAEQLAQDIRYTQALTMGREVGHTIQSVDVHAYGIFDAAGNRVLPYPLALDGVVLEPFSISFQASMGSPADSYPPIRLSRGDENLSIIVTALTGTVVIQP